MQTRDFSTMTRKAFWLMVHKKGAKAEKDFLALWDKLESKNVTPKEAVKGLDDLFIYTHKRIKEHSSGLKQYYPTKQYTKNKLKERKVLWWVDHFTAGISKWATLSWFSSAKRKKRNGRRGYSGASAHFIQGYHGAPFYLIPLQHAAWHEPRRNKDSISLETVNAGTLHQDKEHNWCYWAHKLPKDLVAELPPVLLAEPYRSCTVMQPFTKDQVVNNIKLKRLIIAALKVDTEADMAYLIPERMSQHTDWRKHKTDMGVLWPFEECNHGAYFSGAINELDYIQEYDKFKDEAGVEWCDGSWDYTSEEDDNGDNPEYGYDTPTHDTDTDTDTDVVLDTKDVQQRLNNKGYSVQIDGIPGKKTHAALKHFQHDWNKYNKNKLAVDGIAGPATCACLLQDNIKGGRKDI